MTWKQLYNYPPANLTNSPLPDLAAQIETFISSKSSATSEETIFAISVGFWDIYHLASLDYELAQNLSDTAVGHLITQIDLLYTHFTDNLYNHPRNNSSSIPSFQLIIPKLFDPTLVPGWLSQRSIPPSPSSVAEQQKQAIYLTKRWNSLLENALGSWVSAEANATHPESANDTDLETTDSLPLPRKDIFAYDLPQYVLDLIIEQQLEAAGQSDAAGLGRGSSPFISVAEPCLREGWAVKGKVMADGVWNTVCADPKAYLFWDGFNLGWTANEGIGRSVAEMVREGRRVGA